MQVPSRANVGVPDEPPPERPAPAVTPSISPVAPQATAVTLPYASRVIESILVLLEVEPYVPAPAPPVAMLIAKLPVLPPPVILVPALTQVIVP